MKIFYEDAPDKDDRHWIWAVVLERELFEFVHSINEPLLEMEVDEVSGNSARYQDMRRALGKRDAGLAAKYYVIDEAVNEDIGWVRWVDPNDGTEPPPVLEPRQYQPVTFAVDVDKARMKELNEKAEAGTMTAAEEKEAFKLVLGRIVEPMRDAQVL